MDKELLIKKDDKVIPNIKNEIRLFMVVRNEAIRLPYFYKYYLPHISSEDTTKYL